MIYKVIKSAISRELADFVYSYFLMKNVNYEKIVCDDDMFFARETAIQWFIENRIGDFYPEYAPDVLC